MGSLCEELEQLVRNWKFLSQCVDQKLSEVCRTLLIKSKDFPVFFFLSAARAQYILFFLIIRSFHFLWSHYMIGSGEIVHVTTYGRSSRHKAVTVKKIGIVFVFISSTI